MVQERRLAPRARVRLVVGIQGEDRAWMERFTDDLSRGGTFIETDTPLPVGTLVKVVLPIPLSDQVDREVEIEGSVARHGTGSSGGPPGMGIEFIAFPAEDRKAVVAYVDSLLKKKKP